MISRKISSYSNNSRILSHCYLPPNMTSPPARPSPTPPARPTPRLATLVESFLILGLCILHGGAIWQGMEGRKGLDNPWPLARHDHPIYFRYRLDHPLVPARHRHNGRL